MASAVFSCHSCDCMASVPDLSHSSTLWDWNEGANVLWGGQQWFRDVRLLVLVGEQEIWTM